MLGELPNLSDEFKQGDRRASGTAVDRQSLRRTEHRPGLGLRRERRDSRDVRRLLGQPARVFAVGGADGRPRPHARLRSLQRSVRPARRADAADDRRDQGTAGMGADQQQEVRPDPLGRSGDADQHALRRADAGRSRRTAGPGLEEAGVLPGPSQGDRGLRARMHLARCAAGDDEPVRHAGHHLARRAAGAVRQAGNEEPLSIEPVVRHDQHSAAARRRSRSRRGRPASGRHSRRDHARACRPG